MKKMKILFEIFIRNYQKKSNKMVWKSQRWRWKSNDYSKFENLERWDDS